MLSHGKFARSITVLVGLTFVAMPVNITFKGWRAKISLDNALAKDGNSKGGGNGNGNGKDKGSGEGGGNGKGNGNGKNGATSKGSSGKAAGKNSAPGGGVHANPSTGDIAQISGDNIDVLHRNVMREGIKGGLYVMKDGKGRTIVERRATSADEARLRGMVD